MDTRRLETFARIVEIGSLTRAAGVLHIAQPALSQQVNALESELGQRLLIRSKQGVRPTEAGKALYRHTQIILKQFSDAVADVELAGREVAGEVSVGLAPYSTAHILALPLLQAVRKRYPHLTLRITDNFGAVLSEALATGRLDFALLYDGASISGLSMERLLTEELVLLGTETQLAALEEPHDLAQLDGKPLLLPGPTHTIRKTVKEACERRGFTPTVVAEVESTGLMSRAVEAGLGMTLLPRSVAEHVTCAAVHLRPIEPRMEVHLALGTPSNHTLSRGAEAVRELLHAVIRRTFPAGV